MRRMLVMTIVGGAFTAYLAHPHGALAMFLAYILGGAFFAGVGLLSFTMPWEAERRIRLSPDDEAAHALPEPARGKSGSSGEAAIDTIASRPVD